MEINRYEIYRYIGVRRGEPDERTKRLVEDCIRELQAVITPRFVSRTFPLRLLGEGVVDFSCFQVKSRHLEKNLQGCDQIILMAATIGAGVDQLIRRYMRLEVSKGVVMQAASAAMVEAYVNELNEGFREAARREGRFLRPRFSAGYGDFPLSCQSLISDVLKIEKNCGITLTDSLLMMPSKSVTAVIGMGKEDTGCELEGCEVCSHRADCLYSRVQEE